MFTRSLNETRTVVITGATAGVGRAIAQRFARAADRLGLIARDAAALETLKKELEAQGTEVAVEAVDVSNADALFAAARRLEQRLGKIDIWINDAMETVFSRLSDMTPAEFRKVTDVTYLGFVHGTMAALRLMRPRRRGQIIQIGSALAYRGIPLQSAYCGAKHAIRGFTNSVRTELMNEGSAIHLCMIELPAVNTPQFDWARVHIAHQPRPMGRPVQPEVIAAGVYRASHSSWREYWIGWPSILTILGNSILPGYLDRYLARNGIRGQQTAEPVQASRRDNLEAPVAGGHRTRGSFSDEAGMRAPFVVGEFARIGMVAAGAVLFMALGAGVARLTRGR